MSIIRDKVESVVDGLQSASHFLSASRAPLDAYGRLPTPPLLKQPFDDIKSAAEHGSPFHITDIVGVGLLFRVHIAHGSSLPR
jgi:hypothetical protein